MSTPSVPTKDIFIKTDDTTCKNTPFLSPIIIPNSGINKCNLLCSVEFNYQPTGWKVKLQTTPDASRMTFVMVREDLGLADVKYNGDLYILRQIEFFTPSLHHTMENNKETSYDCEMCLYHQSVDGQKWLNVSLFLLPMWTYNISQDFFQQLISPIPINILNEKVEVEITLSSGWNPLLALPYQKSFFIYMGSFPYSPCFQIGQQEIVWMVFDHKVPIHINEYELLRKLTHVNPNDGLSISNARYFIGNNGNYYAQKPLMSRPIYYNDGEMVAGNVSGGKVVVKCKKKPKPDPAGCLALNQNDMNKAQQSQPTVNEYGSQFSTYKNSDDTASTLIVYILFVFLLIGAMVFANGKAFFMMMCFFFMITLLYALVGSPASLFYKVMMFGLLYMFGSLNKWGYGKLQIAKGQTPTGMEEMSTVRKVFEKLKIPFYYLIIGLSIICIITFGGLLVTSGNKKMPFQIDSGNGMSNFLWGIFSTNVVFYKIGKTSVIDSYGDRVSVDEVSISQKGITTVNVLGYTAQYGNGDMILNNYIKLKPEILGPLAIEFQKYMFTRDYTPKQSWQNAVTNIITNVNNPNNPYFTPDQTTALSTWYQASYNPQTSFGYYDFISIYRLLHGVDVLTST